MPQTMNAAEVRKRAEVHDEARERSPIESELAEVEDAIHEAHALADQLENRLIPISAGETPELGLLAEVHTATSPVATQLRRNCDGIQTLNHRLRNIQTRLEL